MADFVKAGDLDFVAQLRKFREKIGDYAPLFGLSAAQLANIAADEEWFSYVVLRHTEVPGFAQDWTKLKNQVRHGGDGPIIPPFPAPPNVTTPPAMPIDPNVEGRFRSIVTVIKANANYSKAIGEALGIEAPEDATDYSTYKPVFSLQIAVDQVLVRWKKLKSDGVNIYKKVGNGTMVKIDFDPKPNYLDKSEMPPAGTTQQWTYKLRYVKNEVEVGDFSTEMTITVSAS